MAKSSGQNIEVVAADTKNIAKSITDKLNGKPLWPYFIIFALLCLLAEITLLRFWGKPTINNERNSEQTT